MIRNFGFPAILDLLDKADQPLLFCFKLTLVCNNKTLISRSILLNWFCVIISSLKFLQLVENHPKKPFIHPKNINPCESFKRMILFEFSRLSKSSPLFCITILRILFGRRNVSSLVSIGPMELVLSNGYSFCQ